jgi:hypothetical protein
MNNHIVQILSALVDAGVRFVLAGGAACVVHGVERLTVDLDLSVDMEEANLRRFIDAMNALKLTPRAPVPAEALLDHAARRQMIEEKGALAFTFLDVDAPYRQVDVFLLPHLAYERLRPSAEPVTVRGRTVWVASKKTLVEHKQAITHPRQKDIDDIRELSRLLGDTR